MKTNESVANRRIKILDTMVPTSNRTIAKIADPDENYASFFSETAKFYIPDTIHRPSGKRGDWEGRFEKRGRGGVLRTPEASGFRLLGVL